MPGGDTLAKSLLAECPWFVTRQNFEHSAYRPFPVVVGGRGGWVGAVGMADLKIA